MREAEVHITDAAYEAMGIAELVSVFRAADLQAMEELTCYGDGGIVQVTVGRRVDEDRLDDLDYVDQWERVDDAADACVYVVGFTAPGLSGAVSDHAESLVGTCDPAVSDDGTTMSLVGPQDAIRDVVEAFGESGVSPTLETLGAYDGTDGPLDDLTGRQREVLEAAFELGYYEVPREASAADVAAALGLDPSTVTEHLQRAERNLLTQHLSATR